MPTRKSTWDPCLVDCLSLSLFHMYMHKVEFKIIYVHIYITKKLHCSWTLEPHIHWFVGFSNNFHRHYRVEGKYTHANIDVWQTNEPKFPISFTLPNFRAAQLSSLEAQGKQLTCTYGGGNWKQDMSNCPWLTLHLGFVRHMFCFIPNGIDLRALERAFKKKAKEAAEAEGY